MIFLHTKEIFSVARGTINEPLDGHEHTVENDGFVSYGWSNKQYNSFFAIKQTSKLLRKFK